MTGDPTAEPAPVATETAAPPRDGPSWGAVLALAGAALLALSAVLAWAVQPLFGGDVEQAIYPTGLSLPRLIVGGPAGEHPRLGLLLVVLAIAAAFLVFANPARRTFDLVRRALGVAALVLAVLFVVRFSQVGGVEPRFQPPAGLRAGFYVCLAGALVSIAAGRSPRPGVRNSNGTSTST